MLTPLKEERIPANDNNNNNNNNNNKEKKNKTERGDANPTLKEELTPPKKRMLTRIHN